MSRYQYGTPATGEVYACRSNISSSGRGNLPIGPNIIGDTTDQEQAWSDSQCGVENEYNRILEDVSAKGTFQPSERRISELGWTRDEVVEIRSRLASFAKGWDAPGMEDYDDL